ncbi:MAG: sulfatase [Candidatus Eisenbacteria bacterium]|nr:sulfatase [Candidatus Eisenbacteria bacterium]
MRTRTGGRMARGAAALLLASLFLSCGGGEKAPLRGAVLILIDTCRYDDVGARTEAGPVTPNLDAFTERAVRFTRASSPAPWTLPSVASLLTGLYPTSHGAAGRYPEFSRLRDEVTTLPERLRAAGFRTAAFVNVAFLDPVLGLDRGFDLYDYVPGANLTIRRAGETFDEAIRWLDENREEPFFLLIHLFDPHMDFDPPEPFRTRFLETYDWEMEPPFTGVERWKKERMVTPEIRDFARTLYRAEIAAVDEGCGRFFEWMDGAGLMDETVVVVTADHGEEFWDHGRFEHGHSLYEELLHVPLLLRAGNRFKPAEVDRRVGLVDVMPTLLDVLGEEDGGEGDLDGESLAPLIEGKAPDGPRYRFAESLLYGQEWKAVIGERYKFSYNEEQRRMALFDLLIDPGEKQDLAETDEEIVKEMADLLLAWFRGQLERTGGSLRGGEVVDMEEEVVEKLRSLGYIR